jgi:hypothetical protein
MTHAKVLKEKIDMFLLFNQMQRKTALLCVGPMTHAKALKEKIDMFLLFNQMQRQTTFTQCHF